MLRITHVEMFPLETKQSSDKLIPHSDLREGVFLEEVSRSRTKFTVSFSRRTLLHGVSK
jgi:hypothetical protein